MTLSCACGSPDVIAVKPGDEPEYARSRDMFGNETNMLTPILVRAGSDDAAWCAECWPWLRRAAA